MIATTSASANVPTAEDLLLHPQLGPFLYDFVDEKSILHLRAISKAVHCSVEQYAGDTAFEIIAPYFLSPERLNPNQTKLLPWPAGLALRHELLVSIVLARSAAQTNTSGSGGGEGTGAPQWLRSKIRVPLERIFTRCELERIATEDCLLDQQGGSPTTGSPYSDEANCLFGRSSQSAQEPFSPGTAAAELARKLWSLFLPGQGQVEAKPTTKGHADDASPSALYCSESLGERPSFVFSTGMAYGTKGRDKVPSARLDSWPFGGRSQLSAENIKTRDEVCIIPKWFCCDTSSIPASETSRTTAGTVQEKSQSSKGKCATLRRLGGKGKGKGKRRTFPKPCVMFSYPMVSSGSEDGILRYGPVLPMWTNVIELFLFGPPWVTCIGENFLTPCYNLKAIHLDGFVNLDRIGDRFCELVSQLELLEISPTVRPKYIGAWFLNKCYGLPSLELEFASQVTDIKQGFLYRCYGIKHLDLSPLRSVEKIGSDFVNELMAMESLVVGPLGSVSELSSDFLYKSKSLTEVDFSALEGRGLKIRSGFVSRCPKLKSVDLSPLSSATSVDTHNFLFHTPVPIVTSSAFPCLSSGGEFADPRNAEQLEEKAEEEDLSMKPERECPNAIEEILEEPAIEDLEPTSDDGEDDGDNDSDSTTRSADSD